MVSTAKIESQLGYFPILTVGARKIWRRNFLQLKKNWLVTIFWISFEPFINLIAIGLGLGSYVNNIDGMTYLDFYMPGLLCSTAMMVSFFESTYGSYTKIIYQKTYSMITLTPIDFSEIFHGELIWAASKSLLGVFGLAIVASLMGVLEFDRFLLALPMIFCVSLFFSGFGLYISSIAKHYDYFTVFLSGLIVPMSLLCGTYFPIQQLPTPIKALAYLAPLTHSVEAVRKIFGGHFHWLILLQGLGILLLTLIFTNMAIKRFKKRLD